MVSPANTIAPVTTDRQSTNKGTVSAAHHHAGTAKYESVEQTVPRANPARDPEYDKSPGKDPQIGEQTAKGGSEPKRTASKGERRDFELEDGKLMVRVYSNEGRLLREIAPGYLPLGKPRVNITV